MSPKNARKDYTARLERNLLVYGFIRLISNCFNWRHSVALGSVSIGGRDIRIGCRNYGLRLWRRSKESFIRARSLLPRGEYNVIETPVGRDSQTDGLLSVLG